MSGMWSCAGVEIWRSVFCFWCRVDMGCVRELPGCGSLETVEIYTYMSNMVAERMESLH